MERVSRILRLLVLLQSREAMTTQDLMDDLGVSRRTLFRDLKMLELAGVPYYYEAGTGYRIGKSFFLPPVSLTVPETLGLMLLAKSASVRKGGPLSRAALAAISKLNTTVPAEIYQACTDLLRQVSIDPGAQLDHDVESSHYLQVQQSIDAGQSLRVTYQGPTEPEALVMRLDPYALHFASRAWYVLGYCDRFGEVRILKLNRIMKLELLERKFVKPRDFSPAQKIGKAWHLIPEGKVYRIELHFSPRVAQNVVETRWHASQEHVFLEDGSCLVRYEVDGLSEISWWVCGYAQHVRVVKPKALAGRVRMMLQKAADQYESSEEAADTTPAVPSLKSVSGTARQR